MAVFNEILAGRFNRAVQKLFGMKGPPPVPQLGSEILPVHPFQSGVENRYLEGWNLYGRREFVGPVAAQFGAWQLRNPSNSGVMVVIEQLAVENAAAHEFVIQLLTTNADLATLVTPAGQRLDARSVGAAPSSIMSQTTLAAVPTTFLIAGGAIPAGGTFQFVPDSGQEVPLLPGDAIVLTGSTANAVVAGYMRWRERTLEDSEKN